jgi:pectate lyase
MSDPSSRLLAVQTFADIVLTQGPDRFRGTPLLADGVEVATYEPVRWLCEGQSWVICNPACQQNLYRTFVGLSHVTGDPRYRDAAVAATRHFLSHYSDSNGLPHWGGHQFVDLHTGNIVGEQAHHEFKACYPYYEFLYEIEPAATVRLIKALWNAHVLNWSNLDMSRHGVYDAPMGALWDNDYIGGDVFFEGKGLTFIRAGSDLVYAAGMLHHFTGDQGALTWARRLAHRYVEARDPVTQLGAYQYSQPTPTAGRGQAGTFSWGGDRARNQFGLEFGERALEGKLFDPFHAEAVNGTSAIAQMRIAEMLGVDFPAGAEFLDWVRSGMLAYARHAYNPDTNIVIAMFTDGTPITPADVKRKGYYSPSLFESQQAAPVLLMSYAMAWRLTRDPDLWRTARAMARHRDLGDIGESAGSNPRLNLNTTCDDPVILFALLELTSGTGNGDYVRAAGAIADNIVQRRIRNGLFVQSQRHVNAHFSALEPLAILSVEAALAGKPEAVPAYTGGQAFIQGPFDGMGRTTDLIAIWSVQK